MSAAKHTPGPWRWFSTSTIARDGDVCVTKESKERDGKMKFLVGADGQGFAHTVGLGKDGRDAANADLLAAAPDLLGTLKEAEIAICELLNDAGNPLDEHYYLPVIREVIAKAEGRTT